MVHKLLIIDDNHSFIDTLQVMLKGLTLHYESVFRYNEAEKKIYEFGSRLNHVECQKILQYALAIEAYEKQRDANRETSTASKGETPAPPIITQNPINPEGYSLVIVEQDTEPGRKGLDFIVSILRSRPSFAPADFLLLTGKPSLVEDRAKALGIAVLEKSLKNFQLLTLIQSRLEYLKQQTMRIEQILARYHIKISPATSETHPPKKSQAQLKQKKSAIATSSSKVSKKSK